MRKLPHLIASRHQSQKAKACWLFIIGVKTLTSLLCSMCWNVVRWWTMHIPTAKTFPSRASRTTGRPTGSTNFQRPWTPMVQMLLTGQTLCWHILLSFRHGIWPLAKGDHSGNPSEHFTLLCYYFSIKASTQVIYPRWFTFNLSKKFFRHMLETCVIHSMASSSSSSHDRTPRARHCRSPTTAPDFLNRVLLARVCDSASFLHTRKTKPAT